MSLTHLFIIVINSTNDKKENASMISHDTLIFNPIIDLIHEDIFIDDSA